jgi:hypothetical protein
MHPNVSLLSVPSVEPKVTRVKEKTAPRYIYYFTMCYEQWRRFYDHKTGTVCEDWGDQIALQFKSIGIVCTPVFRYHHGRAKDSRKRNTNLFSAIGYCKADECPVLIDVEVENQSIQKGRPCLFTVVIIGDKNHDPKKPVSRQVKGAARERIGMLDFDFDFDFDQLILEHLL